MSKRFLDPCESFFDYTCDGFVETDKMNHTGLDFIQHRITRIIQDGISISYNPIYNRSLALILIFKFAKNSF